VATPEALSGAQLPALILAPELGGHAPGFEPDGFVSGAGALTVHVTHLLLVAPAAGGLGRRSAIPAVVAAVDAYTGALADDPLLGGALAESLRIEVALGVQRYAGVDYHGAALVHTWVMALGG
jgi:hypothetical protein